MDFKNLFSKKPETLEREDVQCTHDWKLIAKSYGPPRKDIPASAVTEVAEKAMFGVTTLLQECSICHALRKQEMLGSDENQLNELLDKVDKFGMQYVKENNKVYAIAQWVPDSQGK